MDKLTYRVRETIEEHHMLETGDRVIAALSGGADSVCLLSILTRLRESLGIRLRAVHIHHGLRGDEADRDGRFAAQICRELSVPFSLIKADVKGLAAREGLSQEEAGRILRYECFHEQGKKWENEASEGTEEPGKRAAVKIAVAHHSNDQAETILHNLFRGSGLGGLKGIPYVRGNVIRPLLDVSREDIVAYLMERGLSWVEDSTNHTDHYTRNRIRLEILPAVEEKVNPGAGANVLRMGKLAGMADAYLKEQSAEWIKKWTWQTPEDRTGCKIGQAADAKASRAHCVFLPEAAFRAAAPVLQLYVVMELLKHLAGSAKDLGLIHAEAAQALFDRQPGRRIELPYGLGAVREYGGILLGRQTAIFGLALDPSPVLSPVFTVFPYKKGAPIPKNMYTKWFDCDKIKGTPVIRTRQPGDYLALSEGVHKPLRRYMIDEKIPSGLRDRIPLLADGSHVMWVIGYRISSDYKISALTERVFQAEIPAGDRPGLPRKKEEYEKKTEDKTMADKIRVLLTEEEVEKRINEVAEIINRDYQGKEIHLICILKGGVFFTCELAKRLTAPVSMDFMSVSSYGAGTVSSGVVRIIKDLDEPLEGKNVLIVEDIIDSGRTLAYLIEVLKQRGPADIRLCTLLDKPERRVKKQVKVDYTCFTIPDEFVVGYGLDYDQKYRNLPYIGVVEQEG